MALSLKSVGILALHLLSIACTVTATNPCYFPDGNIAPEFVPCSPNGDGDCCVNGDFCTQWGFCISDSKGYHYRGACTDTAWGNPSCPRYCLADSNSGNSTFVNVIACNAASTDGTWCCAYDGNCCSASTFAPSFGTIFAEPGASTSIASAAASGTTSIPAVNESSTPTSSPSTVIDNSSTSTSISSTAASNSSTAVSTSSPATGAAASSSQTPDPLTSKPKTTNTGTIAATVAAVVLGIAALTGFGLFAMERKKRLRMEVQRPEVKSESFTSSGSAVLETQDGADVSKWSQSEFSDQRHELSSQVTPELPSGYYGR